MTNETNENGGGAGNRIMAVATVGLIPVGLVRLGGGAIGIRTLGDLSDSHCGN
jgi:hypothetical protein